MRKNRPWNTQKVHRVFVIRAPILAILHPQRAILAVNKIPFAGQLPDKQLKINNGKLKMIVSPSGTYSNQFPKEIPQFSIIHLCNHARTTNFLDWIGSLGYD